MSGASTPLLAPGKQQSAASGTVGPLKSVLHGGPGPESDPGRRLPEEEADCHGPGGPLAHLRPRMESWASLEDDGPLAAALPRGVSLGLPL